VIHEYGHYLEQNAKTTDGQRLSKPINAFLKARTAGEREVYLTDVGDGHMYGVTEMSKPDKFITPYTGKQYPRGATEVLSTGLQALYQRPVEFARSDQEHFLLTLLAAKGQLHS